MNRLLFFTALLLCSACAPQNFISIEQPGYQPLAADKAEAVVAKLKKQADAVKFTKVLADVNVISGSHRDKLRQVLVLGRDGALRFDLFSSGINQLLLFAQSANGAVEIYDARSGKRESKALTRETLAELVQIPADVQELMLMFAGEVPLEPEDQLLSSRVSQHGNDLNAEISAGGKLIRLAATRKGDRLEIQRLELILNNSSQTNLSYVRDEQGVPVRINAEIPKADLKLMFEINAIQIK